MDLKKIKCVITDFDKTLYSDANLSQADSYYCNFLLEHNLVSKDGTALKKLREQYPNFHMIQFVFKIARENNFSDEEIRQWFDEHIYNIISDNMRIVSPQIIKNLCKKLPVYILTDSCEGYLAKYLDLFGYDKTWFKECVSNQYKGKNMSKYIHMKEIVEKEGLTIDEVLMVGDSLKSDIAPAEELGIQTAHVIDIKDTERIFNSLIKLN